MHTRKDFCTLSKPITLDNKPAIMKSTNILSPKTRTQLAIDYGIDRKTLYNWIVKLDLPINNGMLSPKCLKIIYREYGNPKTVHEA